MKIIYDNGKHGQQEINIRKITITLNDDVDIEIKIDNFGKLNIQKQQYGIGCSSIIIEPCVSNEISIS